MTTEPQDPSDATHALTSLDAAVTAAGVNHARDLDDILDALRTRNDETPQWEFCEGFMVALICCRRSIEPSEYMPVLLDVGPPGGEGDGSFADLAQAERFYALWFARWNEIAQALATEVDSMADERCYYPEVTDVRGALAAMTPEERAEVMPEQTGKPPAYAQVWALGFMYAVESWAEEWVPPRDKQAAKILDACLHDIVVLTEDDTDPPTPSHVNDADHSGFSPRRLEVFSRAVWSVYDLFTLWRDVGPRGQTVYREAVPGRNDPCHCGSGKKFKKCHGA